MTRSKLNEVFGAENPRDLSDDTHYIGTDSNGRDHFALVNPGDDRDDVGWFLYEDEDGNESVQVLRRPTVTEYALYVEELFGWDECLVHDQSASEVVDHMLDLFEEDYLGGENGGAS